MLAPLAFEQDLPNVDEQQTDSEAEVTVEFSSSSAAAVLSEVHWFPVEALVLSKWESELTWWWSMMIDHWYSLTFIDIHSLIIVPKE